MAGAGYLCLGLGLLGVLVSGLGLIVCRVSGQAIQGLGRASWLFTLPPNPDPRLLTWLGSGVALNASET